VTGKIALVIALCILPEAASADILHILDSGTAKSHSSNSTFANPHNHVTCSHSAIPGSGWDFSFGFEPSSAAFQWTVDVTVEIDAGKAGHSHNDPTPRLFYYPNWPDTRIVARFDGITVRSPQFAQDQGFVVHMAPVNYAAGLKVLGTYTRSDYGATLKSTLTHFLDIVTPGIGPMPVNDRLYKLTGATAAHPENHYASSTTAAALIGLSGAWRSAHPSAPLLDIGNISLPWGGAFDVKGDWKADNMQHAYGIAADIGKSDFTSADRVALIKLMCRSGFHVYNRIEGGVERYHVVHREEFRTLKRLNWPVSLPTNANSSVNCCAAKAGDSAWRKCTDLQ
jgi:hypothetical protein